MLQFLVAIQMYSVSYFPIIFHSQQINSGLTEELIFQEQFKNNWFVNFSPRNKGWK